MILYHCADLIWATKIKGTAEALGLAARPVRNLTMLEARLADTKPVALIVDLDDSATAIALLSRLRPPDAAAPERAIRTLAFGPHVAVEAFAAARKAGADAVMARGGFNARIPEVLQRLATTSVESDLVEP